jgi:hypothetical protein
MAGALRAELCSQRPRLVAWAGLVLTPMPTPSTCARAS